MAGGGLIVHGNGAYVTGIKYSFLVCQCRRAMYTDVAARSHQHVPGLKLNQAVSPSAINQGVRPAAPFQLQADRLTVAIWVPRISF